MHERKKKDEGVMLHNCSQLVMLSLLRRREKKPPPSNYLMGKTVLMGEMRLRSDVA